MKTRIASVLFLALIIGSALPVFSQNYSVKNSLEIIVDGLIHHSQEEYRSAIKEYDKVHRNDTNYPFAQYQKTLSLFESKKYKQCAATCKSGLGLMDASNKNLFYQNYGRAETELKNFDKAMEIYDSAIKEFPYNSMLKYYRAESLIKAKKYQEGLNALYDNLRENPTHPETHYFLGDICRDLELHGQALLSYLTYFIMETNGPLASRRLIAVDDYLSGDLDGEGLYIDIDFLEQGFDEIDEILANKVAVTPRYTTPSVFTYPVIKQMHMMLKSLSKVEADTGFWNEFYVPYYKRLMRNRKFSGMTNYIVQCLEPYNPGVAKNLKKGKVRTEDFKEWYAEAFDEFYAMQEVDGEEVKFHFAQGKIEGIGEDDDEGLQGDWIFYHTNGKIMSEGKLEDGEKQGNWTFYHRTGGVRSVVEYDDGKANGPFKNFFKSGLVEKEGQYKDDLYDGLITTYYSTGGKYLEEEYEKGVSSGKVRYYHRNGELRTEGEVKDGVVEGTVTDYAINGEKVLERNYAEGKLHGPYKSWYMDGTLTMEAEYQEGELHGTYKRYHLNGELAEEAEYVEGHEVGKTTEYYENGNIETEYNTDTKGNLSGAYKTYFEEGGQYGEFYYKKNRMYQYAYFNKDGKKLTEGLAKGKYLDFKGYDTDGYLFTKGLYKKGKEEGEWKQYDPLKLLTSKKRYSNGELVGDHIYYYYNGETRTLFSYKNGSTHGDYHQYFKDGKSRTEGYYRKDKEEGEFIRKNNLGKTIVRNYYKNGDTHGWQTYYTEKGELGAEEYYDEGIFLGGIYYGPKGEEAQRAWLDNGNGEMVLNYQDGSKRYTANYQNGELEGEVSWYYPNGKLEKQGKYISDTREGEWKDFYDNGQVENIFIYVHGMLEGKYVSYFKNGNIEIEGNYEDNSLNGSYKRYFENGKLRFEYNYKNDMLHGECKYYAPSGDLIMIRHYVQDVIVGISYLGKDGKPVDVIEVTGDEESYTTYYQSGEKSATFTLEHNYFKGDFIRYHTNGEKYKLSQYKNGILHGDLIRYREDGTKVYHYRYKFGQENGMCVDYYPNEKPKEEYSYYNGELEGTTKMYNEAGEEVSNRFYFNNRFYSGKF